MIHEQSNAKSRRHLGPENRIPGRFAGAPLACKDKCAPSNRAARTGRMRSFEAPDPLRAIHRRTCLAGTRGWRSIMPPQHLLIRCPSVCFAPAEPWVAGKLKRGRLILLVCAAATASGQSLLEAENLLFAPPKDFNIGFESNRDSRLMTEWVRAEQTVEDWSEMLTVQIYRGASVDAETFLRGVGNRYMNACPGTTAKGIFTGQVNGYAVSMLLLKCPKNPGTGKPETTALRVIKGNDALYSVQHAWRSVPTDQAIDDVMRALAKVTVCDTRVPSHPCPSFDSLVASK